MNENINLFEEFENIFEDYLEKAKANLEEDKKYNELKKERHNILAKNKNLTSILEGEIKQISLSNNECLALYELIKIHYDMQEIENKKLFLLGGKDMYFFLKKIEIIAWFFLIFCSQQVKILEIYVWVNCKFFEYASNVFVLTHTNTHTEWDKSQTLILN